MEKIRPEGFFYVKILNKMKRVIDDIIEIDD